MQLKQTNYFNDLKKKWWPPCDTAHDLTDSDTAITIGTVVGSFILLAVGLTLSIVILFIQSVTLKSHAPKLTNESNSVQLQQVTHTNEHVSYCYVHGSK